MNVLGVCCRLRFVPPIFMTQKVEYLPLNVDATKGQLKESVRDSMEEILNEPLEQEVEKLT